MKIKHFRKMAILPMVIFVIAITAIKFGFSPSVMENQAEAAVPSSNIGILSSVKDWRQSKIIRTTLSYQPSKFYSLNHTEVRKLFGKPSLSRKDGQSRMVQYTYNGCVADFYYMAGGDGKIKHYEIRQLDHNEASDCLQEILTNL